MKVKQRFKVNLRIYSSNKEIVIKEEFQHGLLKNGVMWIECHY